MIDERFSASEFKKLGRTSPGEDDLHKELQREIAAELHATVEASFRAIANRLRELGHHLNEAPTEFDPDFASWSYEHREGDGWKDLALRIWLHTQVGVLSGYYEKPHDDANT